MHDANHNAYSSNPTINRWLGYTINLMGGAVFNWKLQHNVQHHTFTNIHEMDDDIDSKLLMRFSPHSERKGIHRFQHIYWVFLYGISYLVWIFYDDFQKYNDIFEVLEWDHKSLLKNSFRPKDPIALAG